LEGETNKVEKSNLAETYEINNYSHEKEFENREICHGSLRKTDIHEINNNDSNLCILNFNTETPIEKSTISPYLIL